MDDCNPNPQAASEQHCILLSRNGAPGAWQLAIDGGAFENAGQGVVNVGKYHDANLTFAIQNNSGAFSSDPIWIQAGPKPSHSTHDHQIKITGAQATILKIHDSNSDVGQLRYVLNFADGSKLDPIINNGGHPFLPPIGYLGVALVIAAIVGLLALRWRRNDTDDTPR